MEGKRFTWLMMIDDISRELRDEFVNSPEKPKVKNSDKFVEERLTEMKDELAFNNENAIDYLCSMNEQFYLDEVKKLATNSLINQIQNSFKGTLKHSYEN